MQYCKPAVYLLTFLFLAASASAQSSSVQLQQMVEQLQKTPNDDALREKIIQLAPTLKPSPVLPDTAITFEGRAQFAFRSAISADDFLVAAREYEKAVAAAPWVPGYYADLCTIYEKAGKFEAAKGQCGFYLTSLTDPAQITDVKRRIAGLEFGIEKALAAPRAPNLARLQGTWVKAAGEMVQYYRLLAEGDTIKISAYQYVTPGEGTVRLDPAFWGEYRLKAAKGEFAGLYVAGAQIKACTGRATQAVATLSADGNEITLTTTGWYDNPKVWDPRGWNTADTKSCAYDPGTIGRLIIRKQP